MPIPPTTTSLEEYQATLAAYNSGAVSVTYGGKSTTYRSLADMERIIHRMEISLGLRKPNKRRKVGDYHNNTESNGLTD